MKHFLLAYLFPTLLTAQNMQLTEQLGKTVLYDDIALSPDGTHVAWVQATAATTSKQTYFRGTSGNAATGPVNLATTGERKDSDPAWSPDSKSVAFFSDAGEKDQAQLWTVNADGSDPKKITHLKGYAARPRWSHDGKRIAFLYIEGAGGGGPLTAAPVTTGVIDTAIHNQRIAVLDVANRELRQVSPPDLHIYDYDWSPDDKRFVTTAAPGPGDNNWWIAQIYTIDIAKGNATSIYKPSLQLAVPRWSPDGKSVAFIEGLMSDEGFHGGDLFTISVDGRDVANRTRGRKSSVSSLFWQTPDRILFTEYVGGGSAISELTLVNNSVRTIWKSAEGLYAFGNFPDFAVSKDGKFATAVRSNFETAPEVWAGPIGEWRQITANNSAQTPTWGKAENGQKISDGRPDPWRTFQRNDAGMAGWFWNVEGHHRRSLLTGLLCSDAQSSRKLWPGRRVHPRQRERFWRRRFARHARRSRRRDKKISNRSCASGCDRVELRRVYDHVDCYANEAFPWRGCGGRHCQLAKLLWPELDRSMDDPVLRCVSLRRPRRLREKFSHSLHQKREVPHPGDRR